MTQRDFEIKLGLLALEAVKDGLDPDWIVVALRNKLEQEVYLQKLRRLNEMSY